MLRSSRSSPTNTTIADNYHLGGTVIQHLFLGTGDDIYWSDSNGNPTMPPSSQIANPNPKPGTNNQYTVDGRFSNCSDAANAPGVALIVHYLGSLPYDADPNCAPGHYYMLNNRTGRSPSADHWRDGRRRHYRTRSARHQ